MVESLPVAKQFGSVAMIYEAFAFKITSNQLLTAVPLLRLDFMRSLSGPSLPASTYHHHNHRLDWS
jgi:hypothetical protein